MLRIEKIVGHPTKEESQRYQEYVERTDEFWSKLINKDLLGVGMDKCLILYAQIVKHYEMLGHINNLTF